MAKISNTIAYPGITPTGSDYLILTDSSDNNATKTVTVQALADFIDDEVTLQEVLNAGNTATQNIILTGDITGTGDITRTGDITLTGDQTISGLSTLATVDINGGNVDNTRIGTSLASDAKFTSVSGSAAITTSGVRNANPSNAAAALRVFVGPVQFGNTSGAGFGDVGNVMISNGSDGTPEWISQDDLEPSQVVQKITNRSGGVLNYGDVVSIDPTSPNQVIPDVIKADNTTTLPAIGVVSDTSIANNSEGYIVKIGLLYDIDSAQFIGTTPTEGQIVYMTGGSDAGKMSVDRPTGATTGIQNIGIITRVVGGNFDLQVVAIGRTNALPNGTANSLWTNDANNQPVSTAGRLDVDIANNSIIIGNTAPSGTLELHGTSFRGELVNSTAAGVNNFSIGLGAMNQAFVNGGSGLNNTAIGVNAMQGSAAAGTMDASYNVAVGQGTLASITALSGTVTHNTAVGYLAMRGGIGSNGPSTFNTAIGAFSLQNINASPAPSFGDLNTAVGSSSLFNMTSGEENVALGASAGTGVTTGDKNVFIGAQANTVTANVEETTTVGYNADSSANKGTALGAESDVTGLGGVALGWGAQAAGGRLNIKVDGAPTATPFGGLPQTPVAGPIPPAGLAAGDVYVITGVTLPGAPGPANVLAIV